MLSHAEQPELGALQDHTEAQKNLLSPLLSVGALIEYGKAEARGLLESNIDIGRALVAALIGKRTLVTDEIDQINSANVVARSLEKERKRRDDWQLVIENAARFSGAFEWR